MPEDNGHRGVEKSRIVTVVAVTPDIRVNGSLSIPANELVWRFGPSGGPGGQHANTANTRAEVVFEISDSVVLTSSQRRILSDVFGPRLRVVVDEARSQTRNRVVARQRLADKLAVALKPKPKRRPTKPSRGSKERRLKAKKEQSQRKAQRRRPLDD